MENIYQTESFWKFVRNSKTFWNDCKLFSSQLAYFILCLSSIYASLAPAYDRCGKVH